MGCDITEVISKIENPFKISSRVFNLNTCKNVTLYVPSGTADKYKATEGWKEFLFIEEGNGGNTPETKKCETPTISYSNGKLTFNCSTEGATCQSTITNADITSYSSNEVQLGITYNISVYATKTGYENSKTTTATLCWIEQEPKTEGLDAGIAQVPAKAVLIQSNGGTITIYGLDDGTKVSVYSINGNQAGSTISQGDRAIVSTTLQLGNISIIKIGEKSVKMIVK